MYWAAAAAGAEVPAAWLCPALPRRGPACLSAAQVPSSHGLGRRRAVSLGVSNSCSTFLQISDHHTQVLLTTMTLKASYMSRMAYRSMVALFYIGVFAATLGQTDDNYSSAYSLYQLHSSRTGSGRQLSPKHGQYILPHGRQVNISIDRWSWQDLQQNGTWRYPDDHTEIYLHPDGTWRHPEDSTEICLHPNGTRHHIGQLVPPQIHCNDKEGKNPQSSTDVRIFIHISDLLKFK